MRKLRRNLKKQGCRALTAVMIASSLLGMTAPAFAKEYDDVQPIPVVNIHPTSESGTNTEDKGTGTEDNIGSNTGTNTEDKGTGTEDNIGSNTGTNTEDKGTGTEENTSSNTGTNTEDKKDAGTGTNTEDKKDAGTGTNTEDKKDAGTGTDTEDKKDAGTQTDTKDDKNTGTEDKKADKDAAQKEAEKKKADEEWEKKKKEYIQKGYDELGMKLGPAIAKIITGKYESVEDAICEVGTATIEGINEGFVRNIPFGGGFAYSLIKAATQKTGEPTDTQQIVNALNEVDKTIERCKDALIQKSNTNGQDSYILAINNAIDTLYSQYEFRNKDLDTAIQYRNTMPKKYNEVLSNFYTSDYKETAKNTNPYFNAFKTFVNKALGNQTVVGSTENGGGRNVYQLSDYVAMDGKKHIMESYDKRKQLVVDLKNLFSDGNSALRAAMETDQTKVDAGIELCQYQKGLLKMKMENTTDSVEKQKLQDEWNKYDKMEQDYLIRQGRVVQDLKYLKGMETSFKKITEDQESKIAADKTNFDNNKPAEKISVAGNEFSAITAKKRTIQNDGSVKTEEVKAYPTYNKEKDSIEYVDQYGYMVATKGKSKEKMVEIAIKDIKVDNQYILHIQTANAAGSSWTGKVTINKVWQGECPGDKIVNWFTDLVGSNKKCTTTMIDYTDEDGNKHYGEYINNINKLYRYKFRDDVQYESGYEA